MAYEAIDTELNPQFFDNTHLTRLMEKRKISTTEVGARCGRSAHTIRLYALGQVDPPASVVGMLAHALGVPVEALYREALPDEIEVTTVIAPRRIRRTRA